MRRNVLKLRTAISALRKAAVWAAALAAISAAASWLLIDWEEDGSDIFPGGAILRDATGEILRVTLGSGDCDCRPTYTADEDDWIVKALVAVEDGTFWTHCGVRPLSIARAFAQNVFHGRRISGASTLTMQTVRLIHPHRKSYWMKWIEAIQALKLERRHAKIWIISQYLNRAPFGANFIGIEAASHGWFGKSAKELGLGEAAILAAMVQAPSRYRPDRGGEAAFKRRDHVLERMMHLGMIDSAQAEAAKSIRPVVRRINRPFRHPYYCDWFVADAKARGGALDGDVTTPLDPDVQLLCDAVVNQAADANGYSVAAVVLRIDGDEPATVALACSGDYFSREGGQVNTAISPRPAGSTLKPFLAALAMDCGAVTPGQRLMDAPVAYKGYRPANFDSKHRGPVKLRDALILSLNIPFVQLLERIGLERFGAKCRELGFAHMNEPDDKFGLGMAIGNLEITLVELAQAYAKLATCAKSRARAPSQPFSPESAYLVSEMLSGDERSAAALGHVADIRSLPRFAWKTGTSSAYRDAWCVLWNPEFVVAVWCGHKRGGFGHKTLVGAVASAPLAWRIARALYPQGSGTWFARPQGVAVRKCCTESGLCATPACPETENGQYIRGVSAPTLCEIHNNIPTEKTGGKSPRLAIVRPEDGARFTLVEGMAQQRIGCEAIGNPDGCALWWFIDGAAAGRTIGREPFALEPSPGEHTVTCADSSGAAASATFVVEQQHQ